MKTIATVSLSLAIIAASVATGIVHFRKSAAAQAKAEAAAAKAEVAAAEARKAEKLAVAEASKAAAKKSEAEKAKFEKEAAEADLAREREEKLTAEAIREAKAAQVKIAEAEAAKARELREAEALRLATAKEMREKEALEHAKAEAAANEAAARLALEKQKSDKVIAEAKLLELRQVDFEALEREFAEWKVELEERERALQPEKTIADLSWAGGNDDSVIDAEGNVRKQQRKKYDPEKDLSLPTATRRLARAERKATEARLAFEDVTKARVVAALEKLYVEAIAEGSVIEAQHIRANLLSMYPDWKLTAAKAEEEKSK